MAELGREIAAAYQDALPVLVAPLKSSAVFLADLSRTLEIDHELDVIELAPYGSGRAGGGVRLLKDLDRPLEGRDVLLVEDVVDTGLTLGFLTRSFAERAPASLAAVTLLDRPYRRLVDDISLALRRVHGSRRALRRLRPRPRRALARAARPPRRRPDELPAAIDAA